MNPKLIPILERIIAREEFSELSEFLETMRIVPAETPETENIYA